MLNAAFAISVFQHPSFYSIDSASSTTSTLKTSLTYAGSCLVKENKRMKVLDLFCGRGGWSIPFIEDGDDVTGIDIVDVGYPKEAKLVLQDIREVKGFDYKNYDLIIGSPPCVDFSNARYRSTSIHHKVPTPQHGFELIEEFWRIVKDAKPQFYAMENIEALTKYYPPKPQWRFMISKGGKRCLWTNIPIPLSPEFRFKHKIRDIAGWDKTRPDRAKIPYNIARFIADCVKAELRRRGMYRKLNKTVY
jgi:SAM-dependent methyltransferase